MAKRLDRSLFTAKFKRDYVAMAAVVIFFLIVVTEVTLAISIPSYFLRSDLWALQIARQRMLADFDGTRRACDSVKISDTDAEEENKLVLWNLNLMAHYLRTHRQQLPSGLVAELAADIRSFGQIAGRLKSGRAYNVPRQLDDTAFLRRLAAGAPAETEVKQ